LLEQPNIEATRIVWEHELEGTAIELMNAAEGETAKASKLDEAKRFLRAALSKGKRPATEIKAAAAAENITWGTLKRASEGGEVIQTKGWPRRLGLEPRVARSSSLGTLDLHSLYFLP
jgi:hypothetical protein